jgi:hypothetical protein
LNLISWSIEVKIDEEGSFYHWNSDLFWYPILQQSVSCEYGGNAIGPVFSRCRGIICTRTPRFGNQRPHLWGCLTFEHHKISFSTRLGLVFQQDWLKYSLADIERRDLVQSWRVRRALVSPHLPRTLHSTKHSHLICLAQAPGPRPGSYSKVTTTKAHQSLGMCSVWDSIHTIHNGNYEESLSNQAGL